jgi:uncharacterized protein
MSGRRLALVVVTGALVVPATAEAHVSIHPNTLPTGAFATLDVRVPNEQDNTNTTKVQLQLPDGFTDVSFGYLPGWTVSTATKKLAHPFTNDDGDKVTSEVSVITWKGDRKQGKIPPGDFLNFPISVVIPGKPGSTLTFKTLQYYSNGQVVRWIGPASSDQPAPTIAVTAKNGVLQDVAGSETGPPAGGAAGNSAPAASVTRVVQKASSGASKGLAITALIVGILGLLAGGAGLFLARRARATA